MISSGTKTLIIFGALVSAVAACFNPFHASELPYYLNDFTPNVWNFLRNFLGAVGSNSGFVPQWGQFIPAMLFLIGLVLLVLWVYRTNEEDSRLVLAFGACVFTLVLSLTFAMLSAINAIALDESPIYTVSPQGVIGTAFGYACMFAGFAAAFNERAEAYSDLGLRLLRETLQK